MNDFNIMMYCCQKYYKEKTCSSEFNNIKELFDGKKRYCGNPSGILGQCIMIVRKVLQLNPVYTWTNVGESTSFSNMYIASL
jgi:hypothetical protein